MIFSAVIPTYNRAALLRETLESVFAQTFTDYEIIVVDDGSTDDTLQILQMYGERVHVFRQENAGPGAARNLGANHARGEYLAFLDSDDLWFPWTLKTFAELIHRYRFPAILSARLVEFDKNAELAVKHEEPVCAKCFSDYLGSSKCGYFVGAGMAVLRRNEFLKTGGFIEQRINGEDHDIILRLGTAPGFVQVLQPVTLGWRRHPGGATADSSRTYEGNRYLIQQETRGNYPGGKARFRERSEIITRHVRPAALECLGHGMRREAWELYRETVGWHIKLGRWKFLAAFPLKAILGRA